MKSFTLVEIVGAGVVAAQRFGGSADKAVSRRMLGLLVDNGMI